MKRLIIFTLICVTIIAAAETNIARGGSEVILEPDNISIGFFYSGRKAHLRTETPPGYDVVVKVAGPDEGLRLKKKGKVGGFLWMNVGEIGFENVPNLYMIGSSRGLADMLVGDFFEREQIGYDAINFHSTAETEEEEEFLFGEFVKLKEKEGLYSIDERSVHHRIIGDGNQEITAEFDLPAKAPLGKYQVMVYGIKNGDGTLLGTGEIQIAQSSPVAFISSLAYRRGLLYGCLAVVIAVVAGLFTGMIFGMGKGKAH
ncbi:MAG: TIGR02186 family protein [bacterium]